MLKKAPSDILDSAAILDSLLSPVMVLGPNDQVLHANPAMEQFLGASLHSLRKRGLGMIVTADGPLTSILAQTRRSGKGITDYDSVLELRGQGRQNVALQSVPVPEYPDQIVLSIFPQSVARKVDDQLSHRAAARSVSAMAATMAHEIRNPLSGIRGAAQLIAPALPEKDQPLASLICEETDRICALVDRLDIFTEARPAKREPVNIHRVLEHVRRLAHSGFARDVHIRETYDPSLPQVLGNRDQLIQVFLNLIKNAAEAVPKKGGEIHLSTAYHKGVKMRLPASNSTIDLPLLITVADNGSGVPEALRNTLFEPFVTDKASGAGLGLPLVAKIIQDHGGVIDYTNGDSGNSERGTHADSGAVFHVMLPLHPNPQHRPDAIEPEGDQ